MISVHVLKINLILYTHIIIGVLQKDSDQGTPQCGNNLHGVYPDGGLPSDGNMDENLSTGKVLS